MVTQSPVRVFESHTKLDEEFCDVFDRACARVGVRAFRLEYEDIKIPALETIRSEIQQSEAIFLLIGKALVKQQRIHEEQWSHTQNWIAYEIGIANALNKDVWVLCDAVEINFPVPYFNNYIPYTIRTQDNLKFLVSILRDYVSGENCAVRKDYQVCCPYSSCAVTFNLHASIRKGNKIVCPCCLNKLFFPEGRHPEDYNKA